MHSCDINVHVSFLCLLLCFSPSFFAPANSSEDQLLWMPGVLPMQVVEDFLLKTQRPQGHEGAVCTQVAAVQDNEQVQ